MKKIIGLMMLAASITQTAIAQEENSGTKTDRTFEIPADYFKKRFTIDLGKGNKMQVELSDIADLDRIKNIDSILRVFLQDIAPLKDTLSDELSSKRIDYLFDTSGKKKMRLQIFKPKGSSFLLQQGDIASLKLEQDTVNFISVIPFIAKYTLRKAFADTRYYRVSFFVNQLSDLNNYTDGRLNEKISAIQGTKESRWVKDSDGRWHIKDGDHDIYAKHPAGYIAGAGNYLIPRVSVNIQNYKNYFTPSFSLGASVILSNGFFKRDIGLFWEPNFFFAKNAQGNLQTFRNDFLTLTFGQGSIKEKDPRKESSFLTVLSLGYLINRKGDFFEKNTFRLGAGELSLFGGKTKIEPVIYFTNLFKRGTPGLRWIQSF
jgi:hypothetical protein